MVAAASTMVFFDGYELGVFAFTGLALASALVTWAVTVMLVGPADRLGLTSKKRRDRFGRGHIALTAGPGLFAGIAAPLAALRVPLAAGELVALAGLFAVGLLDDRFHPRPGPKFAMQGAVAVGAGLMLAPAPAYAALVALVFLVLVNACNYLDNMDGLLAGVALMQAIALVFFTVPGLGGAPLLIWSLPAVLMLTIPPARVYLGDSGSHLVGALLAIDVTHLLFGADGRLHARFLLPLLVLFAVPIADMATVTISRLRRGRPVFRGGTDHLSHRLVRMGYPVPRAVLVLVLASGVCGAASLFLVH